MMKYSLILPALTALSLTFACTSTSDNQSSKGDAIVISQQVEEIKREKSPNVRNDLSLKLIDTVRSSHRAEIDDRTIDNISSLLDMRDEGVRASAAAALGQLGPRAKRAIPDLESALDYVRSIDRLCLLRLSADSGDSICSALRMIGGQEEEDRHACSYHIDPRDKNLHIKLPRPASSSAGRP